MPTGLGDLMKNKAMTDMITSMMKSGDPNSPIVQMLRQQMPNASPQTAATLVKCLGYFLSLFFFVRRLWAMTATKIMLFSLVVLLVAMWLR